MNRRIAAVRKALNLTQAEFSESLGTSRVNLSNMEIGRTVPTEMFIKLICTKYGVDEIWLRTGAGEMFREVSRDEQVAAFFMSTLAGDDQFKKAFVSALSQLDECAWEKLKEFAEKLYEDYKGK